jgi:hypothetical protein
MAIPGSDVRTQTRPVGCPAEKRLNLDGDGDEYYVI